MMIIVNTTRGWMDFCQAGIETNLVDMDGMAPQVWRCVSN